MARLELPNGQWADIREPDGIPRKAARKFRAAFYKAAAPAADIDQTLEAEAKAVAAGKALLESGGMDGIEDMTEALVFAVVSDWSFGPVNQDVLDNMPDDAVQTIYDKAQSDGHLTKLMPDFGVDDSEDSPTTP